MNGNTAKIEILRLNHDGWPDLKDAIILKTIDFNAPTTKLINSFLEPYYKDHQIEPIVEHEVKALEILAKYDIAPIVKSYGRNFIQMSYVGEEAKSVSVEQIDHIVSVLNKADIVHNDLVFNGQLRNCTMLDGRVYLVDFQLASISGIPPVEAIREKFWRVNYDSDEKQLRELCLKDHL